MYHRIINLAHNINTKIENYFHNDLLLIWITIFYGTGISIYFSLHETLQWPFVLVPLCIIIIYNLLYKDKNFSIYILSILISSCLLGYSNIKWKTESIKINYHNNYFDTSIIKGKILTLEKFPLYTRLVINSDYKGQPYKIRITTRGKLQPNDDLQIGDIIQAKMVLQTVPRQTFPGGYNLRQSLYYQKIQYTGYAISKITKISGNIDTQSIYAKIKTYFNNFKHNLTRSIITNIKGQNGAIVAALVTGEKSYIKNETKKAFADSGIAHILAISGLHMSIVVGIFFFLSRLLLCTYPPIATNHNTKKISAIISLCGAFIYLSINGANIPAQRAFIMSSVILCAILIDRIAINMRNVALAALMILLLSPESLDSPSFQLSFSAVIALVATYEKLHPYLNTLNVRISQNIFSIIAKPFIYFSGIITSSVIATIATAPFTIFTFNQVSITALASNLIAIPLISFAIIPLIIIYGIIPLDYVQNYLNYSIESLIKTANFFQIYDDYILVIPYMPTLAKWLIVSGMIITILVANIGRIVGITMIIIAVIINYYSTSPDIFINQKQNLIVVNKNKEFYTNTKRIKQFTIASLLKFTGHKQAYHLQPDFIKQKNNKQTFYYHINNLLIQQKCTKINNKKKYRIKVFYKNKLLLDNNDFWYNGGHFIWVKNDNAHIINSYEANIKKMWS